MPTQEDLYDAIITYCIKSLYGIEKEHGAVVIKDLDKNNKTHLFMEKLLKMTNTYTKNDIYINFKGLKYYQFKMRTKIEWIKPWKGANNVFVIDCDDFLTEMAQAFNETPEIFEKIYEEYYNG